MKSITSRFQAIDLVLENDPLLLVCAGGGVFLFLVVIVLLRVIKKSKLKLKDLKAKGYYQETPKDEVRGKKASFKIGVQLKRKKLIFTKYSRTMTLENFWQDKNFLEHIYGQKIVDMKSIKRFLRQPKIIIYFEDFPANYTEEDIKTPERGEFHVGITGTGEEQNQDIRDESVLGVFGQKSSGKSNAINSCITSFYKNSYHTKHFDLILFDFKLNDFIHHKKTIKNCSIFDTSDLEQFKRGVEYLERKLLEWTEYKRSVLEKGVQVQNFLDFDDPTNPKPMHLFIVIDEASQFLSNRSVKAPGSKASQKEKDNYERFLTERRLVGLVDFIMDTQRYMGNFLILGSQSSRAGDYAIRFTNIKSILLSRDTKAQSLNLTGDSNLLLDRSLYKGKFIYVGNGKLTKVMTPFIKTPFKPPGEE
ncbi:MAG: hypothetical protein CME65_14595 [Halobacteriovoraceae bacterium]|nr:hypothetical protein [Halobacteriovoraceae bacterium]|tara:strand:+ start:4746 stop:6002 length:1257 start_codon:yes stop_codon:yes gene_type:complete